MNRLIRTLIPFSMGLMLVLGLVLSLHTERAVAATAPNQSQVIDAGLAYLKSQQQPSGGIMGFSEVADPDTTVRSVLAFVVAGQPVSTVVSAEGNSLLDYLASQAITFTHDTTGTLFPGRAGELLAAVSLTGMDLNTFGGMDLIAELEASYNADTGFYSTNAKQDFASGSASDLNQGWAILGLSLAGQAVPDKATQFFHQSQALDGSWGSGDPDTTALALTALLASRNLNAQDQVIQKAINYFHATQADSGGWRPSWDTDPLNADSTGWILQALVTAGEDPRGESWTKGSTNPVDALLGLQKPDGSIGGTYANTYSTAEAIIGLSGVPLETYGKAPATHRAGLAIFSGNDLLSTNCISFTGSTVSGLELLQRSGLVIETATNPTQGTAVCKIGDVGDASSNCFGSMPNYWAYWGLGKNGWEYSAAGADKSQVVDGGVYAWSWGLGNTPPVITFQNICEGVAIMLPTSTVVPTPLPEISRPSPVVTVVHPLIITYPTPVVTVVNPLIITYPTPAPVSSGTNTGTYIIYAAILLVLGMLIIYLIRARGR